MQSQDITTILTSIKNFNLTEKDKRELSQKTNERAIRTLLEEVTKKQQLQWHYFSPQRLVNILKSASVNENLQKRVLVLYSQLRQAQFLFLCYNLVLSYGPTVYYYDRGYFFDDFIKKIPQYYADDIDDINYDSVLTYTEQAFNAFEKEFPDSVEDPKYCQAKNIIEWKKEGQSLNDILLSLYKWTKNQESIVQDSNWFDSLCKLCKDLCNKILTWFKWIREKMTNSEGYNRSQ